MPPETPPKCPTCNTNLLQIDPTTTICPKCDQNRIQRIHDTTTKREITQSSLIQQIKKMIPAAPPRIQIDLLKAASQNTPLSIESEDFIHYFGDLDLEIREYMSNFPERFKIELMNAIQEYTTTLPIDKTNPITINITQSQTETTKINEIRRKKIDTLITIKGNLAAKGDITPEFQANRFYCGCNSQKPYSYIAKKIKNRNPPTTVRCPNCGNDLFVESRIFDETITLVIEQDPQETENQEGNKIYIRLKNELTSPSIVDKLSIGKQILITGILDYLETAKKTTFYIKAFGIRLLEEKEEEPTPDDEKHLRAIQQQYGDLIEYFGTKVMFTTIHGFNEGKIGLVLSKIGTYLHYNQNKLVRPTIPTLFCASPSTGKSQLLKLFVKYFPGNLFVDCATASGPGLTSGIEKDPFTDANIPKPGALVKTKDFLAADEFNRMSKEAMDELLSPMENLEVTRTKIASARYVAQKTINAACNPVGGFFDKMKPKHHQIGLEPAILSRFDIILLVEDIPNEQKDEAIHKKLLSDYKKEDPKNPISKEPIMLFRKYIKLTKTYKPTIPDDLDNYTAQFYLKMRMQTAEDQNVIITPRQSESINRIAIAHAKGNLREILTKEDYDWAFQYFTRTRGVTTDGKLQDFMVYDVGSTANERNIQHDLIRILPKYSPGEETQSLTEQQIYEALSISDNPEKINLVDEILESTKMRDQLGIINLRGRRYAKN